MNLRNNAHIFILVRSRQWLNDTGRAAHTKTEWWLIFTGQAAQIAPDYSDIENTLKEVADYLHDDKLVADKTDPTYAEANIIIETYIEMESYLSDYCLENGITINSLEELKEKSDKDIDHDYLKELYDYTVAKISEQE